MTYEKLERAKKLTEHINYLKEELGHWRSAISFEGVRIICNNGDDRERVYISLDYFVDFRLAQRLAEETITKEIIIAERELAEL